jgi:hypothetical protein
MWRLLRWSGPKRLQRPRLATTRIIHPVALQNRRQIDTILSVVALRSRLFFGNPELEACLVRDSAHLTSGVRGEHVRLVQTALVYLGYKSITGREYLDGVYGRTTAHAVLRYKTDRRIINFAYQIQPDNIVGKMTIKRLDDELVAFQDRYIPPRY